MKQAETGLFVDRLFDTMTQIETLEADIDEGLDTLDTVSNGFFKDGTESAYQDMLLAGEDGFRQATGAISFISKKLRETVSALRDFTDTLYRMEQAAAEGLAEGEKKK